MSFCKTVFQRGIKSPKVFFRLRSVNVKVVGQPDNILFSKQKPEAPKGKKSSAFLQ